MANLLDLGVYAWLIIFALWGGAHGFITTLFGLGAWLGAGMMAERFAHWFGDWAAVEFSQRIAGPVAMGAIGFIVTFVVLRLLVSMLSGLVKDSPFSTLNRGMGVLAGIFAGGVLLALAYFTASSFVPRQEWPQSVMEARTRPLLEVGASWVAELAPKEWGNFTAMPLPPFNENGSEEETATDEGYDKSQRRQLERLLNQTL